MKKIRWGIVGPGNIAGRFARAVKNVACAELAAVASRDGNRGAAFAETHEIPHVFEGYAEMAASDAVDAVYIATPHPFHKPCAELFLNAGKHVLCEKPMCVNAAEARRLQEIAARNGVFLMEAMWTRFLPAVLEAQKIIAEGQIGDIRAIEADFCYFTEPNSVPRLYLPSLAGGSLLDVGVYGLHFAAIFLGSAPETVTALAHTDGGVDIHTSILLKYPNGAVANITSAIGVAKPETGYIYGTNGHISFPCFYGARELTLHTAQGECRIEKDYMGNGFEEEILEVCRCIQNGKSESHIMPLEESIAILQLMDTVRAQIGIQYPFE